jgi:hypothetical protein
MTAYREQVAAALRAVTIRGATRYAWLGRAGPRLAPDLEADLDETTRQTFLATSLAEELYASFYCRGRPVPTPRRVGEPVAPDPHLVAALSGANTGRGSWDHGWTVERRDGPDAVVAASRVRARVPIENCRAPDGLRRGAAVAVRIPKALPALSPGFYTAVGDTAENGAPTGVARAYWHVTQAGAPALMRALTARLNAAEVPFRLKVADHPFRLDRCDAAVLYVPVDGLAAIRRVLLAVATDLAARLRPEVPAFSLLIAPGLALAEDAGGAESFGSRRCRLLAEAIVRAHVEKVIHLPARIEVVAAQFAADGIALDAPYRDPSLAGRHVL